jgi:hypothetical protein
MGFVAASGITSLADGSSRRLHPASMTWLELGGKQ